MPKGYKHVLSTENNHQYFKVTNNVTNKDIGMKLVILRLSHRKDRDKRITTHCMLVGRAFGCEGMYYSGEEDDKLHVSIEKVCKNWGGDFFVKYVDDPRALITEWKNKNGRIIHLTMYGENIISVEDALRELYSKNDLMVIIGGSKVPSTYYRIADMNIAIGHQPHSEVAALALLLDRILLGKELQTEFTDAKFKVVGQKHSKKVIRIK